MKNKDYFNAGFHFTWGALCCLCVMMIIGFLLTPSDDCDKSFWDRCGLAVKIDNKTGVEYLVTSSGGIIERKQGKE